MQRCALFFGLVIACAWSTTHASVQTTFHSLQNKPDALYAFLKDMPKGGELHYHYDGAVYTETMLQVATHSKLCIHPKSFTSQVCQDTKAQSVKDILHNPKMMNKIVHAWSMQDFVPYHESAHDHFFSVFPKVGSLYGHEPLKGPLLAAILQKAAEQHELYMEIIAFGLGEDDYYAKLIQQESDYAKKTAILLANPSFQHSIEQIIKQSNAFLPAAHAALHCDTLPSAACDIQVNFQYYIRRVKSLDSVFAQALAGFVAAEHAPNIVAINLLDIEDDAVAQRDYAQQMQIFAYLHHHYPKAHIALHAGELYPKKVVSHPVLSPIRDAIVAGHAERIGHGLDILEEPHPKDLAKLMASKGIAVEVNLTSNHVIFGVHGNQHPFKFYLQQHVPVVLSTDDEGILRTELTNEYLTAIREHHIDYLTLKHINRNTLTYGFIAGTSIWRDPEHGKLIPECRDLASKSCQKFIEHNPKGYLQWQLEQKLAKFELKWQ